MTRTQFEACSGIAAKHKKDIVDKGLIDFSIESTDVAIAGGDDKKEVSIPCTLGDLQVSIREISKSVARVDASLREFTDKVTVDPKVLSDTVATNESTLATLQKDVQTVKYDRGELLTSNDVS